MRHLTAVFKLIALIGHLLRGCWTILTAFPKATPQQQRMHVADWARGMLEVLNVNLRIQGTVMTQGPLLVVMNHISWLDIMVLLAAQPVRFVSKSEVRHWPLIGWLATHTGTLYIERASRRDALKVVHQIAQSLKDGDLIAVFPEGTTSDGGQVLPFHANLMQAAISVASPVQPVALRYRHIDGSLSTAPVYIGDDTLAGSIWRLLCSAPTTAQLDFLGIVPSAGQERRPLALQLEQAIAKAIDC